LIESQDGAFVQKVDASFAIVETTLAKYRQGSGYEPYSKLTDEDRKVLAANVNALAENLSTLRGKLGLD
jgi:iron uptake system component EfeO